MRRALGGGPEVLALVLVALWFAGLHVVPLVHAAQHRTSEQGHCHGAVCHDLPAADPDRAEVRDGTLPALGDRAFAHGDVLAVGHAPVAIVPAVMGLRAPELALAPDVLSGGVPPISLRARGPPGVLASNARPPRAAA